MYDSEKGLFCHRLRKTSEGLKREGISQRYTVMTLLGLLGARRAELRSSVDIEDTIDQLFASTAWIDNVGDLGLLLWLCASVSRERLRQFQQYFKLAGALKRFPDGRRRLTMELSWFLTGLVKASKMERTAEFERLALETYALVSCNQGESGLLLRCKAMKSSARSAARSAESVAS